MRKFFWHVAVGLDRYANTLLGGLPGGTLSATLALASPRCGMCRWICRLLHRLDPDHCERSLDNDVGVATR